MIYYSVAWNDSLNSYLGRRYQYSDNEWGFLFFGGGARLEKFKPGSSLVVRIQCFHSSDPDSIPGQGTEISQTSQYSHKKVKDNHSTYILVPLGSQRFSV